jgi:hypothetical protein
MTTSEAIILLVSAIGGGAATLAAALKLLASAIARSIAGLGGKVEANTAALEANTAAMTGTTAPGAGVALAKVAGGLMRGRGGKEGPAAAGVAAKLALLLALALTCQGCVSTDPLTVRSLERNRQVWQEDRRADLDPELVKSRETEFDAQLRYEKSKGD